MGSNNEWATLFAVAAFTSLAQGFHEALRATNGDSEAKADCLDGVSVTIALMLVVVTEALHNCKDLPSYDLGTCVLPPAKQWL